MLTVFPPKLPLSPQATPCWPQLETWQGHQTCGGRRAPKSHQVSLNSYSHLPHPPALLALQRPHHFSPVGLPPPVPPSLVAAADLCETQRSSKARFILRTRFRLSLAHRDPENPVQAFRPHFHTKRSGLPLNPSASLCALPHLEQPSFSLLLHLLHLEKSFLSFLNPHLPSVQT